MPTAALERQLAVLEYQRAALRRYEPPSALDVFCSAIGEPDSWQRDILLSDAPNIWTIAARQSGKSTVSASIALADMLRASYRTVLIIAPIQDQASEILSRIKGCYNALGRPLGALFNDATTRITLANGSRCLALSSVERSLRSYSPNLVLYDEAALIPDNTFYASLPLLAATHGRKIAVSTPRFRSGWWYDALSNTEWQHHEAPANVIDRYDPAFLHEMEMTMPHSIFMAEFYCQFLEDSSGLFPAHLINAAVDHSITPMWSNDIWT